MRLIPWRRRPEPAVREIRVPASASGLARVRECVDVAAAKFGLDDAARRELVFAVNEAATNAIRHGAPDRDGMIVLRLATEDGCLSVSVSDRGVFVGDTERPDPLAESGRGFTLMYRLVDEIQLSISRAGTTLRLAKRRDESSG
jgi:serine/threonine-protein kinase RsbW